MHHLFCKKALSTPTNSLPPIPSLIKHPVLGQLLPMTNTRKGKWIKPPPPKVSGWDGSNNSKHKRPQRPRAVLVSARTAPIWKVRFTGAVETTNKTVDLMTASKSGSYRNLEAADC